MGANEDFRLALEDAHDLGNGVTYVVAVQRGRPAGSTGFLELRYATVSTWADDLAQRSTQYTHIHQGRAAAERLANERG